MVINKIKKGQALVEMAIVLPVLLICIGIIITAGQIFFARMVVQMATYEGARIAVVQTTETEARRVARDRLHLVMANAIGVDNYNDIGGFSVSGGWNRGGTLTYSVTAYVRTLFPIPDSTFTFNSRTQIASRIAMRIERN